MFEMCLKKQFYNLILSGQIETYYISALENDR